MTGFRRLRCARHLPPVGDFWLRTVHLSVHRSDPGEVDPDWSLEAPADPHLEPGVRPLLDSQDAGPAEPDVVLFTGSPLLLLYLRALGAKVGRGVVIFSTHVPICTDLLTIGEGTVIRKDASSTATEHTPASSRSDAITIGKNVVIGEATVIDIETSMGDGAQLGHASSLHSGQAVPDGERWHGSPASRPRRTS